MKFFRAVVMVAAFAGSLAACGQGGQQPNPNAATGAPAAQPAVTSATHASEATLAVQPANVDGCRPNHPIVARLNWHSNVAKVQVLVTNPGQPVRLFAESGFTGSAKTGNWVIAGTKFELVDPTTKDVLAVKVVSTGPCPSSSSAE